MHSDADSFPSEPDRFPEDFLPSPEPWSPWTVPHDGYWANVRPVINEEARRAAKRRAVNAALDAFLRSRQPCGVVS